MAKVTVTMPLALTPEMMRAVRDDPLCQVDGEQWHARLGWLICAWDVLVASRPHFDSESIDDGEPVKVGGTA